MTYREIVYAQRGEVTVITFNRPHVHNCIGPIMHRELIHAWNRFRDDDGAKVAVLTGAGDFAFCAGGDLKAGDRLLPKRPSEFAAHARGERPGLLGPSRWTDLYKPTIAAVNGIAYAGGLEWACWADIRIAEEHATFGVTCRRWNLGLGDGGDARLPLLIGLGRAMELILTGRVIDAKEAERIGLVTEIVPKGQGVTRALELAQSLCELPQPAIRNDKEALLRGVGETLRERLRIEAECVNRTFRTPELEEGLRRFAERDHPDRKSGEAVQTPGLVRRTPREGSGPGSRSP